MQRHLAIILIPVLLAACVDQTNEGMDLGPEPTLFEYTEPEQSGLVSGRAYPNPEDVCRVIGENDLTRGYLDDSQLLIGCPKHERGAIADRLQEGARIVGSAAHWTLLHAPLN